MDREKVEKLLKEKVENYEELYTSGKEYIREHETELKERFRYARFLEKPLKEKQALFWNGNSCDFDGAPKEMYKKLRKEQGENFNYIWVFKEEKPSDTEDGIVWVKKNSAQYWEALAVSGYLIGSGNLPVPFRKRTGQTYLGIPQKPEQEDIDSRSLYIKELLKMEGYLTSPKKEELLQEQGFLKMKDDSRKKILLLVNWKEEREHRYVIRKMLERANLERYDIIVATPRVMSPALEAEFAELPEGVRKFIYRGRMTVDEKDFLLLRILEKYPQLYVEEKEIKEYVDELMKAEWERIWGKQTFDCVVLSGRLTTLQYFMANAQNCEKKVLVDMEFLQHLRSRGDIWEKVVSVFDEIYTLPLWRETSQKEWESIVLEGRKYLICDTWAGDDHRTFRKLIPLTEEGTIQKDDFTKFYFPMYK